jgi:hypothetical protein
MALSYARFAGEVEDLDEVGLFLKFAELYECIDPTDIEASMVAESLVKLLKRHTSSVLCVLEEQIAQAKGELVREALPPSRLIRLIAGSGEARDQDEGFLHGDDYRTVRWRGQEFHLAPLQAEVASMLHQAFRTGTPGLTWEAISRRLSGNASRMSDIFKKSDPRSQLVIYGPHGRAYRLDL